MNIMERKEIQDKIKFPVVEIFNSIQGEGYFAGRTAVFIRLSGCNLNCPWCDTDHSAKLGEMSITDILNKVRDLTACPDLIVVTGGEPTIHDQLQHLFIGLKTGFEHEPQTAIETNGTNPLMLFRLRFANLVDLITVSPKDNMLDINIADSLSVADEVKVVLSDVAKPEIYEPMLRKQFANHTAFIQACSENYPPVLEFLKKHHHWRLSVQIQKVIGVL